MREVSVGGAALVRYAGSCWRRGRPTMDGAAIRALWKKYGGQPFSVIPAKAGIQVRQHTAPHPSPA